MQKINFHQPPSAEEGDPGGSDAGGRERSHAGHGRGGLAGFEGREELARVLASGGWQLENTGCENPAKIREFLTAQHHFGDTGLMICLPNEVTWGVLTIVEVFLPSIG